MKKFFTLMMAAAALQASAATKVLKWEPQEKDTVNETAYDISKFQSCKLDYFLDDYNTNYRYAENTTLYLEGGKAYHISGTTELSKGFTLETNPVDLALGKGKAKLYVGGIYEGLNSVTTFMLGRGPGMGEDPGTVVKIDELRFKNLDVQVPLAQNYASGLATGNYFMNMWSNALALDVKLLEWDGCDFQGFIRGFFRTQSATQKNIHEMNIKNCTFRNCGYFSNNGSGYSYIYADMSSIALSNILEKVEISENIFYESPNGQLITDNKRSCNWDASVRWNLNIHHNTFVNWNTQASSAAPLLVTGYVPGGSVLGFHDNLFVLTAKEGDGRILKQDGWEVRGIQGGDGSGYATFDIYNNWSTSDNLYYGQIFTYNAFSSTARYNIGYFIKGWQSEGVLDKCFPHGTDELTVKAGNISAVDLMVNPNPPYIMNPNSPKTTDHYTESIDGLYYKQNATAKLSDIYKTGAGCTRLVGGKGNDKIDTPILEKADVNGDGKISVEDANIIMQLYLQSK